MDRTSTDRIVSTVTVQSTLAVFIAAGDFRIRVCGRPTFVSPMVLQFIIYVSAPNPACVKHCAVDRRLFLGSRLRPRCLYSYINTLFFIARSHAKLYSVSQKITTPLPCNLPFSAFFHKRLIILNQFLHTYYTFLSTLDYKFLFSYLKF